MKIIITWQAIPVTISKVYEKLDIHTGHLQIIKTGENAYMLYTWGFPIAIKTQQAELKYSFSSEQLSNVINMISRAPSRGGNLQYTTGYHLIDEEKNIDYFLSDDRYASDIMNYILLDESISQSSDSLDNEFHIIIDNTEGNLGTEFYNEVAGVIKIDEERLKNFVIKIEKNKNGYKVISETFYKKINGLRNLDYLSMYIVSLRTKSATPSSILIFDKNKNFYRAVNFHSSSRHVSEIMNFFVSLIS